MYTAKQSGSGHILCSADTARNGRWITHFLGSLGSNDYAKLQVQLHSAFGALARRAHKEYQQTNDEKIKKKNETGEALSKKFIDLQRQKDTMDPDEYQSRLETISKKMALVFHVPDNNKDDNVGSAVFVGNDDNNNNTVIIKIMMI